MDAAKIAQIKGEGEMRFAKAGLTLIGYFAVTVILGFVPFGAFTALGRLPVPMNSLFNAILRISTQCMLSLFLTGPMMVGLKKGMLDLRVNDDITGCLFYAFDGSRYMRIVRGLVLSTLFGAIMSVVNSIDDLLPYKILLVPAIFTGLGIAFIQVFVLTFTQHIVAKDHDISPIEACTKSMKLMNGHIKDLWSLFEHYLKEIVICIVTFGLGLFYFVPKFQCGLTCFYEHLKEGNT